MEAIETLMTEHRLIERVIDSLVSFAQQVRGAESQAEQTEQRTELGRFVTFISEFADSWHHGKEEDILFSAMVEAGFPREGGPVAVMLLEHEQGRSHVRALRQLSEQSSWTAENRQALFAHAAGYASLLRNHIHKEDSILYPMAERHLSPEQLEGVNHACGRYEQLGGERQEALQRLADELVTRHAAGPGSAVGRPTGGPCCG